MVLRVSASAGRVSGPDEDGPDEDGPDEDGPGEAVVAGGALEGGAGADGGAFCTPPQADARSSAANGTAIR